MKLRLRSKSVGCLRAAPLLFAMCSLGSAATYYVDPSGSDYNSGTSASPLRTVAKGVSLAGPGDTVILNNGTYGNEGHISDGSGGMSGYAAPVNISSSGSASAYITVKAANSGQAILDCGTTSSSLGCDKYIYLNSGARYWTFQGLVFTRGAFGGIGTDVGASFINVINCQFANIGNWVDTTQIGEDGIGFDQGATNWYISGNIFHDIGRIGGQSYMDLDHGIYAKGTNVQIINNVFYNLNKGWSIQVANGATNWLIANNTFAFSSVGNGQIMLWDTINGMSIINNIFYNPANYALERYQASMSNCVVDHNLVYGASSVMGDATGCSVTNSVMGGNPNFVSPATYDFRAQVGGAGIDAGVNLSAVPTDMMGVSRPQGAITDLGSYEFVSAASVVTPPPPVSNPPTTPNPPPVSTTPVPGDITTGLVGWWKFTEDGGNEAYDGSGHGNNATLHNPTWWTSDYGVTNWFSGSRSYGSVSESASLELAGQMTVAFWLRPSTNSERDPRVIAKTYDWDVKLNGSNHYPQLDVGGSYATLNYSLPLRVWNHVVFTFNNGVVTGYVNGVAVPFLWNTFSSSTKIPTWAYGLFLAAADPYYDNPYIGSLDDVRIYNRALSAADVAALHAFLK
jgi:hypothetical protein